MDGINNYFGFILAALILNITPGSDTIYILTRTISQGKMAGVYSVLGIGTGALFHTNFAACGLSVLLMSSALLFTMLKWMGALYLIYLGITTFTAKTSLFELNKSDTQGQNSFTIYKQGFITNLLNPKVAIFFLSLLPQFINGNSQSGPLPFLTLGVTFITTGTLWCLILVCGASYATKTLRNNSQLSTIMQKISGFVFTGLGVQLLLKE